MMLEMQTRRTCSGHHPGIKAALTHRLEIKNLEILVFSKQAQIHPSHLLAR